MKKIFFIILLLSFTTSIYSQEYLDNEKRYMKLNEISTDSTYGFEINNPIKVGADEKAIGAYLNSLKNKDNDRIHIGDLKFNYKGTKGLTMIVLTYEQKKERTTIYFLSTEFQQPKSIVGFSFKTKDDIPKVVIFPSEKIVKVNSCSQQIYSVDDFLVEEKFGEHPKPTTNPIFKGGIDELKKYFANNPLKEEKLNQIIFRVKIAFIVNCKGKSGVRNC